MDHQVLPSLVEELDTLWTPVIQVEVVVNAQWSMATTLVLFQSLKYVGCLDSSPASCALLSFSLLGVEEQTLSSWALEVSIGLKQVVHYHFLDFPVPVGQSGVGLLLGLMEL